MFKRILIPTDGSDLSTEAALRAVPLAKLAGAGMTVLFVQDIYIYSGIGESNMRGLQEYTAAAQAVQADLIAMGSHGRSGLAKFVMGSVAAKVVALSPIPVLVFK